MSDRGGDAHMVKLTELWERTSAKGARYFSGFMSDAQVLLFDARKKPRPSRPEETVHVRRLMIQERDPTWRPRTVPREDLAGGARQHGGGWRAAHYRRPRAPALAGPVEQFDDPLEDIGR